jgi:hypothetical protein
MIALPRYVCFVAFVPDLMAFLMCSHAPSIPQAALAMMRSGTPTTVRCMHSESSPTSYPLQTR